MQGLESVQHNGKERVNPIVIQLNSSGKVPEKEKQKLSAYYIWLAQHLQNSFWKIGR